MLLDLASSMQWLRISTTIIFFLYLVSLWVFSTAVQSTLISHNIMRKHNSAWAGQEDMIRV
jgi:hypothetical protein